MTTKKTAQDPLDDDEMKELYAFALREQLAHRDSEMCLRGERIQRLLVEVERHREEDARRAYEHERWLASVRSGDIP